MCPMNNPVRLVGSRHQGQILDLICPSRGSLEHIRSILHSHVAIVAYGLRRSI